MQMSYQDFSSGSSGGQGSLPTWAQRANEPLVPAIDLAAIKKAVTADCKEVRKASESLAKLGVAAKKKSQPVGDQLVGISSATRERARGTSRTLQEALQQAEEGSAEHKQLLALSEEFKQTLRKFTQQVEETSHLVSPEQGGAADVESGRGGFAGGGAASCGGCGGGSSSGGGGWGGDEPVVGDGRRSESQQVHEQQMEQVATNEAILRDREAGINHLARSVHEVNEIFQDLALLVNEQGTQIDNIQTNIETAATRTERGVRELARASRSQRKSRGRILITTACVLLLIIILYVVLHLTHKL